MTREELFRAVGEVREDQIADAAEKPNRTAPRWRRYGALAACLAVVLAGAFGMSRLVRESCDFILSLPMKGKINSLNASVACGVVCYEIARQRAGLKSR